MIVPLIIERMRQSPGNWPYLIYDLTGENPASGVQVGDVSAIASAWIEWYESGNSAT